jgi:hypothetical protein
VEFKNMFFKNTDVSLEAGKKKPYTSHHCPLVATLPSSTNVLWIYCIFVYGLNAVRGSDYCSTEQYDY